MNVELISLPLSNAFLISDKRDLLVDCGCHGDWEYLRSRIERMGKTLNSLSAVVLTHAHFDHCGCASFLQAEGVPVIASHRVQATLAEGRPEVGSLLGRAESLPLVGRMMRDKLSGRFPPARVDYPVADSLDLSEFGVEGEVLATGGHTASSLSVVLANRSACVGDLIMGGVMGLPPAWKPNFHPLNVDNTAALKAMIEFRCVGYERFYVGHGDVIFAREVDLWINSRQK